MHVKMLKDNADRMTKKYIVCNLLCLTMNISVRHFVYRTHVELPV